MLVVVMALQLIETVLSSCDFEVTSDNDQEEDVVVVSSHPDFVYKIRTRLFNKETCDKN